MLDMQYILVPLVERRDLCLQCIQLLNQEWPRSVGARENTLRKSLNSIPPLSYVLIDVKSEKLVGHARLCPLPTKPECCWIESVIVSNNLRGRGLGSWLMAQVENEAKKFGFSKVYLSSENKQAFYKKCGYLPCEPVLNVGANATLFKKFGLEQCFAASDEPLYDIVETAVQQPFELLANHVPNS
ncbi:unnamed protein product [Thelazia callipaeda]|uniref:N-acetyltransferase domain-containing protein n=1 Tax=Thelazia callipaeda TaxID=103827 RepID=A0A0N5CP84_THECL|nr:unnamed protein product [Thelazia callipaeda]